MTMPALPRLLDAELILRHYLPVHRSTFYEMISKGAFPKASKQFGRKMRFWRREDVEAWVRGPTSPASKGGTQMWIEETNVTLNGKRTKGKYRIRWREADGRLRSRTAYTDLRASKQLMAKLELKSARNEVGLTDPHEAHRARAILEHVQDWIASLKESGRASDYTSAAYRRMERMIEACGWKKLEDVTGDSFVVWRQGAVSEVYHKRTDRRNIPIKPLANRTKNHFFDALQAFSKWCVKHGRISPAWAPLAAVDKLSQVGHEKRKRRAFTEDEQARFMATVPKQHRAVILLAFGTGLRRNELRTLRWADVQLDALAPFVQPAAAMQKGRREDTIPLRSDLAEMLRSRLAESKGEPTDRVFPTMPSNDSFNLWITKAGIPKTDAKGRRVDFHATRHTFNTQMLKAGIPLAHAQKLMRHTDPKLTANAYADAGHFPLAEGMEKLPLLANLWSNDGANVPPQAPLPLFKPTHTDTGKVVRYSVSPGNIVDLGHLLALAERAGDGSRTHNS